MNEDSWYCNSGASRHTTSKTPYFFWYEKFATTETILLGKKNVLMKACSQGTVKIQMFYNGM